MGTSAGELPSWLCGSVLRVGPGMYQVGSDSYKHLFDPLAIVQRFGVDAAAGKVIYRSRYVRSKAYYKSMEQQRIVFSEFGTQAHPDPSKNAVSRLASKIIPLNMSDNGLINFLQMTDEVYVSTETSLIMQINPDTLESIGKADIRKFISIDTCSAHPHYDREGNMYNIGSSFKSGWPKYKILKFPRKSTAGESSYQEGLEKSSVISAIPAQSLTNPSYYHSFAITEDFVILVEQPYLISIARLLTSGIRNKSLSECLDWVADKPCHIHVVEKSGKKVPIVFTCPAMLIFHHINAFVQDGHVIVDLVAYPSAQMVDNFYLDFLRSDACLDPANWSGDYLSEGRRLILPLSIPEKASCGNNLVTLPNSVATAVLRKDGSVHCLWENLGSSARGYDMPTINYDRCNGRKYRYFYASGTVDVEMHKQDSVFKVDTEAQSMLAWNGTKTQFISEPLFVAKPNAEDEDDGVVVATISDVAEGAASFLLVLDAKSLKELARATLPPDMLIPYSLHGIWRQG